MVHALDGGTFYLPMMNANMADKSGLIRFVAFYEFFKFYFYDFAVRREHYCDTFERL